MTGSIAPTRPESAVPADIAAAVADASRIRTRAIDRVAYASDASHFLLTPNAVVVAQDAAEVAAVLRGANATGTRVTFRSGGTSLSGQASGDDLLVDTRRGFRRIDVLDGGRRVRVQPGATVRQVNLRLLRHGYRLGPDPASEAACTIGGVVANNSSGMACGTVENTYRTLESMIFVLPSGTKIDTADADADAHLKAREPELFEGIIRLQRRVRSNPESVAIIERQFAMKNTMGYGVNAFVDFDSPVQVLAHLIIGSEGTLAFVAEATFRTVPIMPRITTALAVFPTLDDATRALPALVDTRAATLELMDSTSIRVGQSFADAPAQILGFEVTTQAALLVEYHAADDDELTRLAAAGMAVLRDAPLHTRTVFSPDAKARATAWKLRKGLYTSVAGARPAGTTALLEDIVVPVPSLAPTCDALQTLFDRYGYRDSVIFGHAKDGNIHFMLTDRFEGDAAMGRFEGFTEEMVDLVLDAGGNLKAEHGTGRVMAPYVRRQYGDELYDVMRTLKRLCDPFGILNPGVIITDDAAAHLRDFKHAAPIEIEADRCVECGYCEPVCPSKDLTLTPRQRIVVRRAMARATASGDHGLAARLERDYDYSGIDTCAVDGMCVTACPVLINTGTLVKRLRREDQNPVLAAGWQAAAHAWGPVT
ncbi:FAD-binding and (Fe-S)-binding domain-containing protein, partial [Microbacterium sp.]|uniref:FAD-binding and (Fe-S)-binding domain-containing protein n=1 Tax=Microbacterium sp. TaxID=51671 RepID=UPI003C7880DE